MNDFATKEYLNSLTKENIKPQIILMFALGITGYIIIGSIDWRLMVGIFFIHWGQNIEQKLKNLKN